MSRGYLSRFFLKLEPLLCETATSLKNGVTAGLFSIFSRDKTGECHSVQMHNDAAATLFAYFKAEPERLQL